MIVCKTASLVEPFEHVCLCDSALDKEAEGFEEAYTSFIETGDMAGLPMKDGETPTVWTLKHIHGRAKFALVDQARTWSDEGESIETLVLAAAVSMIGATGLIDEKGKDIEINRYRVKDKKLQVKRLSDSFLATLPDEVLLDIGQRILEAMYPSEK